MFIFQWTPFVDYHSKNFNYHSFFEMRMIDNNKKNENWVESDNNFCCNLREIKESKANVRTTCNCDCCMTGQEDNLTDWKGNKKFIVIPKISTKY